ncbi:MAG: hypothetical protein CTY37_07130 [Methylotenera sp.]|nr:MAG: hypothetical protein CTY37_07130 [Methylotenera sp.]PPD17734.1 MAG: hypothetical protein CTY27_03250 [Methylotenera sp.]
MAHVTIEYPKDSVVERAIDIAGGSQELMFKMDSAKGDGKKIKRQTFQGWRIRHAFPQKWIEIVHKITRIPMTDLVRASVNSSQKNRSRRKDKAEEIKKDDKLVD